jgi:hypothetical protein
MMKPFSLIVAGLLAVACTTSDGTAPTGDNSPGAPQFGSGPVLHRVSVGGPDVCTGLGGKPGCDANLSIIAIQYADGSVKGQYSDRFAQGGGFHAVVNCLNVVGNEAWISGLISQPKQFAGVPVIIRVRDNGTSANDPPDQLSFSFAFDPTSCLAAPPLDLFDAAEGQTVVVN